MRLRTAPQTGPKRAAEEAEDRAGNEEDRPQGKEYNVAERRQQAEIVDRALDQRWIKIIAIELQARPPLRL